MTIILAMSRNRVIGSGKGMPWSVPDEYRQCLDFVRGQSVIMGRRSFEIFGSDLGETSNFVISRTTKEIRGATVCGSLEQALEKAKETGKKFSVPAAEASTPRPSRWRIRSISPISSVNSQGIPTFLKSMRKTGLQLIAKTTPISNSWCTNAGKWGLRVNPEVC